MSVGRPLEFDPDQALLAAMEVFWRQGYEATSLQDLLAAMSLSKSSLYQSFGSKHELFERCLDRYREQQAQQLLFALEQAPSAMSFLRAMLHSLVLDGDAPEGPKGCLVMNTATEFAGRDASVSDLVSAGTRRFTEVFRRAVEQAQREGDISGSRDAAVLARYIVTTISGLRTMVKAGMDAAAIGAVADVALGAL